MASRIKGINTGVIRNGDEFIALALKIKMENNRTSLFFIPALTLRDIYISFEYRLHIQSKRNAKDQKAFQEKQEQATQRMVDNIPPLLKEEMEQADVRMRVDAIKPNFNVKEQVKLTFTTQGGETPEFIVDDAQISLITTAIARAMQNAGMHSLSLRMSSLLDFLPLYDADFKEDGSLEYDSYTHPAWKLSLFDRTLAIIYHYTDDKGSEHCCGTIVKSRSHTDDKNLEAISRRLIAFSPRLKKLEAVRCRVSVRGLTAVKGEIPRDDCLKALYILRQEITEKAE